MGDLKNYIIASLLFMAVISGGAFIFGAWYSNNGSTATLDTSAFNVSQQTAYINNWGNSTQSNLANAQNVPFLGGAFVVLVGVYQSLVLAIGIIPSVIIPLTMAVLTTLGLPQWFVSFALAAVLVSGIFAVMNAMKGNPI